MSANSDGDLHVYTVNVGQGDCTVVVSPTGQLMVIDAMRPDKIVRLLGDLGINGTIEHCIVTHPHSDHFSGMNRLADTFNILKATLSPFWHEFGMGPLTYRALASRFEQAGTHVTFLSGYSRSYPDGALGPPGAGDPQVDENAVFLEMLGPTNALVETLEASNTFNANHLTIMTRLTWRNFRMVSAGDAQMENWQFFDSERMMEQRCSVLRAAHHGSKNGTQWERINRLDPRRIIVSSDPDGRHDIPDLTGAAIFATFDEDDSRAAWLTHRTGTIHVRVAAGRAPAFTRFDDDPTQPVDLASPTNMGPMNSQFNWPGLVTQRLTEL